MPCLEFVGFTCTNLNFCIAIVFMRNETTEHYVWALRRLKSLFDNKDPTAIMSDRDLAVVKAVPIVFPNAHHLLCRVHVNRNVEARVTGNMCTKSVMHFTGNIRWLLRSPTEDVYESRLKYLKEKWKNGTFMNYVEEVWLKEHKTKLVDAWCNHILHFATRSSNR